MDIRINLPLTDLAMRVLNVLEPEQKVAWLVGVKSNEKSLEVVLRVDDTTAIDKSVTDKASADKASVAAKSNKTKA